MTDENKRIVEKWDGKLPVTMLGGDTVPFVNIK